jgi:endonuclease/exonuclease/phosphatase family metal-dependent hydrolase
VDDGQEVDRKGKLEVITININSWTPFRSKWNSEGLPKELQSATVLCLQEHQLVSDEAIGDAEDWLKTRGYHAVFHPAVRLPSGKTSGGVAIAVRDQEDVGVTDLQLQYGDYKHRVLAMRLDAAGAVPMVMVSLYLQTAVGLNSTNREILAMIAGWQAQLQLPILVAGDMNMPPKTLQSSD